MEDKKYVEIESRVTVEVVVEPVTGEAALKVVFVDPFFNPVKFASDGKPLEPLFLYLKDHSGKDRAVHFKHVSFTAEFVKEGFDRVVASIKEINPFQEDWNGIEAVIAPTDEMNPSGPPKG